MNAGVAPPVPNDVIGDANANHLIGTTGIDRLIGRGGDDLLDGQGGADFLAGGSGNDSYFVYDAGTLIVEKPGEGVDTIFAFVDFQMPAHTDILNLHGAARIGTGNAGDNWIYGNAADNILNGMGGTDRLLGGQGNDTYYVHSSLDVIFENAGEGYDTVITDVSYTLASGTHVELMRTYGTASTNAINLFGNELNNTLHGNSGANVLNGGGGADTMYGFAGNDTYWIDHPGDTIGQEGAIDGNDTVIVSTAMSWTLAAGLHIETIRTLGSASTYAVNLTGNELSNLLVGNAASNQLNGGSGADTMWGYGGDDTYYVDNSGDRVIEADGGGNDTVITNTTFQLQAGSEVELLRTYGSSTTNAINFVGQRVQQHPLG
ncbi:MAG: calcium-binding protein, partial [Rhodospirillales bacterium]|nr:calcium-binding protein [Rhodospirillales bacterium]